MNKFLLRLPRLSRLSRLPLAALVTVQVISPSNAGWNPAKTLKEIVSGEKGIGEQLDTARKELQKIDRQLKGKDEGDTVKDADVVMYKHTEGDGEARGFRKGDGVLDFADLHYKTGVVSWSPWNDEFSSVRILKEGVKVTLFEHKNFGGRSVTFDKPGLYNLTDHGFNDTASSCIVEK